MQEVNQGNSKCNELPEDSHSLLSLIAHCQVPRQHAAAPVPGDVPGERRQRGDLPAGDEEHVQPQTAGAQEVRPEGEDGSLQTRTLPFQVTSWFEVLAGFSLFSERRR